MYFHDGMINLMVAIINQAKADYAASVNEGNYIDARIQSRIDAKGFLGDMLFIVTGDRYALSEIVEAEIFSQLKKDGDEIDC